MFVLVMILTHFVFACSNVLCSLLFPHQRTSEEQTLLTATMCSNLLSELRRSLEQTERPQLEVFSVSVHNSNKASFRVWGSIKFEKQFFSSDHFLFRLEKTNAQRLGHNQAMPITFPLKCMKGFVISILVDLKDENDRIVSYSKIFWSEEYLITPKYSWYNRKLCSVIPGDDGYYTAVYHSIFNGGIQALVNVYVIDKTATMKIAKVYGCITSRYSLFEYLTVEDNEWYSRKLCVRQIEDSPLSFNSESKAQLANSCVLVPRNSALLIDFDVNVNSWGLDFQPANCTNEMLRSSGKHIEGRAIFSTGSKIEHWVSEGNFSHEIEISVEWIKC